MRFWLLAVGVFVLAFPSATQAQGGHPDLLVGLDSVNVAIEPLPQPARDAGLSRESLQTAVELRLRQSGIRVNLDDASSRVMLLATVNVVDIVVGGGYAYSLLLQMWEPVYIKRKVKPDSVISSSELERAFAAGVLWQESSLGTSNDGTFIRDSLLQFVDEFANDYLAANPR